jgi:hypothetical protein
MQNVKRELGDRIDEINKFYNLLENILEKEALLFFPADGNRKERFDLKLTAILKSNMILLLYNFIESTVTNSLVIIHSTISDENCKYQELSDSIQNLLMDFYYKNLNNNKLNDDNVILHLKTIINTYALNCAVKFTYEDYTKFKTGNNFSGNLDSREIKKIADRYGVDFNLQCSEIRTIRDKRNKLAHGELSFVECCNLDTLSYLKVLKDKTIDFINSFVQSVEDYLTEKKYKSAN